MNRHSTYDEWLSGLLRKDPRNVREFILTLIEDEDGISLDEALKRVIYRVGVKEFADITGIDQPNITGFLRGTRKPKPETLDRYLKPFGLRTKLIIEQVA